MKNITVRVAIVDFSDFFSEESILNLLKKEINPIRDYKNPEVVFYSTFGMKHLQYKNAIKVLINVESFIPDFNDCDYSISTINLNIMGRNLWIPACYWFSRQTLGNIPQIQKEEATKRKFCIFLYSQEYYGEGARLRKQFCQKLMAEYKFVECPGKVLHNTDVETLAQRDTDNWIETKRIYFSNFKFGIAFENMDLPGYITEKLTDCYMANVVPIYWGSSEGCAPFPKESMICAHDFASEDELIEYIKKVDQDDELYMSILNANPLRNDKIYCQFLEQIKDFLHKIVTEKKHLFTDTHPLSSARYSQQLMLQMDAPLIRAHQFCKQILKNTLKKIKAATK